MIKAGRPGLWLATALLASTAACVDSGLPGENRPLEEARTRTYGYSVYDASASIGPITVTNRVWMAAGPAVQVESRLLTPVTTEVFALASDAEPYSRLYLRRGGQYVPLAVTP